MLEFGLLANMLRPWSQGLFFSALLSARRLAPVMTPGGIEGTLALLWLELLCCSMRMCR